MAEKVLTAKRKYPRTLQLPVSEATWARIEGDAERAGLSRAEVGRSYLDAGIEIADEDAAAIVGAED